MAHVREMHILGHFVNAHPRYGLPRSALVIVDEFLELGTLVRLRAHALHRHERRPDDHVTTHARADRWKTRIGGLIRRVVAVQAIHAEPLHVNGVWEVDRLLRLAAL